MGTACIDSCFVAYGVYVNKKNTKTKDGVVMKKLVKIMAVAVLIATSAVALTLEDYDKYIANENNALSKQTLICEREASLIFKDPTLCVRAAQISLKEYNSMPTGGYYSYQQYVTDMYKNASLIYNKISDYTNKVKMFKKVLEFSSNDSVINANLGLAYYLGKGVETNKIKAYEHWSIAAKKGDQQAQSNLDILCKESPWACK